MLQETISKDILAKVQSKGWNLYSMKRHKELGPDETIKQCLAKQPLEVETPYALLPVAEDPTDPAQVMKALEKLGDRLGRDNPPTITVGFEPRPVTGFTPMEDHVKIHTPEGTYVNYETFLSALDSIVDAR
jgi:hypothetical protein